MEKRITIDGIEYICTPVEQSEQQEEKKISGYFIGADATINYIDDLPNKPKNYNVFATEKLAKRALAMARISQIMANDKRFGGVVTDKEWSKVRSYYCIARGVDELYIDDYYYIYFFLAFHTKEQAELFLQENEDLVRQYYMLD